MHQQDRENGENQNQGGNLPPVEIPLLQDMNHYLEQNGILAGHPDAPSYQRQDQVELEERVNAQMEYQTSVIDKFVKEDEITEMNLHKNEIDRKKYLLEKCKDMTISIQTNDAIIPHAPLYELVKHCDTFQTLVGSENWKMDTFQLTQFSQKIVLKFLNVIKDHEKDIPLQESLSHDSIIDCCYVVHYLQATEILNNITNVIQSSIDCDNCTSICILADELHLPSLRQAAMKHVMASLDKIQQDEEVWNDIPNNLRNHIILLRNATKSSIIGRGQTKEVIFSSSAEFLAIFHDTLSCHKERLRDAKQRQDEIIQERMQQNRRRFIQPRDVYSGSVEDAAKKILKQEERVKTLQAFYNEQKAIFAKDVETYRGRFTL